MYLTSLRHIGQRTLRFLDLGIGLHEEFLQAWGAKSVATVDEYSGYVVFGIVVIFAQLAGVFVDEFVDEFLYLLVEIVGEVFGLSEKESRGVLEFLHLCYIFKFYINLSISINKDSINKY